MSKDDGPRCAIAADDYGNGREEDESGYTAEPQVFRD